MNSFVIYSCVILDVIPRLTRDNSYSDLSDDITVKPTFTVGGGADR